MIRVVCTCGRVFKAEDRHAGKRTQCPVCGTSLTIGNIPATSSSGGDIDDVPSWWYPSDSKGQVDQDASPDGDRGDGETARTEVLPPRSDSKSLPTQREQLRRSGV